MEGVHTDPELKGMMPRTFSHIFQSIRMGDEKERHLVRVSMLEIYENEVYDLLSKTDRVKLDLGEHPVQGEKEERRREQSE